VFPRLGIRDKVNVKATPRGTGAAAMVAAGEADIAVMPVSEIVHAPGIELVGVLAQEIQLEPGVRRGGHGRSDRSARRRSA
jgi:molybdate transport system substrate-binding protein